VRAGQYQSLRGVSGACVCAELRWCDSWRVFSCGRGKKKIQKEIHKNATKMHSCARAGNKVLRASLAAAAARTVTGRHMTKLSRLKMRASEACESEAGSVGTRSKCEIGFTFASSAARNAA
jgi:hypothetical protein